MSNFVDMTGLTYTGKEAQEIMVKDLYASDLKGYGIRYMSGVKGKQKLMTGEVSELFQEYSCDFTPDGSAKLSEAFIEPIAIKVNLEECYDAFWSTYLVEQTEISLNGGIPSDFYNWFFNNVLQKELKKEYEEIFWNGDTTYTGTSKTYLKLGDGIVAKAKAASNVVKVTPATITVNNVMAKVGEVAAKIDDMEDVNVEGFKIFMNYMDYRKLLTALGSASPSTIQVWANFTKEGDKVYAYGYEVVPTRINKSVILATVPQNLVLGYDVENSEVAYKIIDMRETTLANQFRVGVITNIAVAIAYPELVVITA